MSNQFQNCPSHSITKEAWFGRQRSCKLPTNIKFKYHQQDIRTACVNKNSSTRIAVTEPRRFSICIQEAPFDGNGSTLLMLTDDIFARFADHRYKILVALDQFAAFDCIDHTTLTRRLSRSFGVTGTTLNWISFVQRSSFGSKRRRLFNH